MKTSLHSRFFLVFIVVLALFAFGGCGDDDDDDSGGGGGACDDFCDKVSECGFGDEIGVATTAECLEYCDQADDSLVECVADADNCDDLADCLDMGDDDDNSDDDDDDDDDDVKEEAFCQKVEECEAADAYVVDGACEASAELMASATLDCAVEDGCDDFVACVEGTAEGWKLDPIVMTTQDMLVGNIEFGGFNSLDFGTKITPFEVLVIGYMYDDTADPDGCDIKGGAIWTSLDGADYELHTFISPNAQCKLVSSYLESPEYSGDALALGDHTVDVVFLDDDGQQSRIFSKSFTVEQYAGGTGSIVDEIDDPLFFLPGVNPPAKGEKALTDIYFSSFDGMVMLFNTSAVWCIYCHKEADHLMELYAIYHTDKVAPIEMDIVTLLIQDNVGNTPTETDLVNWLDRDDPHIDITFPVVIDDQGSEFSNQYMINGGIPFSMIVDPDGVIRYKIHGFAASMVNDFEEIIDAIISEFEFK